MTERLTSADVSFFHLEGRTTPQHVGRLAVFEAGGLDYDRLVRLLEERISLVPRYRQRLRSVPGNLANPVWVDDPDFDVAYHVRRSALPHPGTDDALLEFCARIRSRLLDRSRPLWELYFVDGLAHGRVALITKTHRSMGAVDIARALLDDSPEPFRGVGAVWMPQPEPGRAALVTDALKDVLRQPAALADVVRGARSSAARFTGRLSGVRSAAEAAWRRPAASPLHVEVGEQRRLAIARTELDDYRTVSRAHGATVDDVVLATVAGALRGWLISRGEVLHPAAVVRALAPENVSADGPGRLIDLPVGEPEPLQRLAQLRSASTPHANSARSFGGEALVALRRRRFSLVITNVPGPQVPLHAAGARLIELFPFEPLSHGQAMSVALTSYDGRLCWGVNADRDAVPDVRLFASLLVESLAELVAAGPAGEPVSVGRRYGSATTEEF